jgi:hypothetical protein
MNSTTESTESTESIQQQEPPSEESLPILEPKVASNSPPSYIRSIQQTIRKFVEPRVETFFRTICFWETDDKYIGLFIRSFHSNVLTAILLVYWISHTVIHSYWLLWALWIVVGLIWLQHILTGCCIPTQIERRLIGDTHSVLDPMMRLFNVPTSRDNNWAIFLSTTFFLLQSLELYSRTVLNIQSFLFFLPHMLFH